MLKRLFALLLILLLGSSCSDNGKDNRTGDLTGKRVLVFCGHGPGYVHDNIAASATMILQLADENGFTADTTSAVSVFCDDSLSRYDLLVYANASYVESLLDEPKRTAFQRFIRSGKGFVGLHAATCTGKDWEWFTQMIGGRFDYHPPLQPLTLKVVDRSHPSTAMWPDTLRRNDELYVFKRLNPQARILAVWQTNGVKWAERAPEIMQPSIPAVWCNEFEGGRVWYSALGHNASCYAEPDYRAHVLGGLKWAAASPAAEPDKQ